MGQKYLNSPIVEALCEFQFISETPWDDAFYDLFYDTVKDSFPLKQEQMNFGLEIRQDNQSVEYKPLPSAKKMQYFSNDRTKLAQISPNILTINHLKPYPAWEVFKPLILDNLNKYQGLNNPQGFNRIGLRYINKIDIPLLSFELSDYFNFFPKLPGDMPQAHANFNIQVEFPRNKNRLLLALATMPAEQDNTISLLLDMDYNINIPSEIKLETIDSWLEEAHLNIEQTFESCITDKCRDLFRLGVIK